jgi:hypothetical protein
METIVAPSQNQDLNPLFYESKTLQSRPMFPLSCAGAQPRSNWDTPAHTKLLPRSWNFPIFIANIMHIIKKFLNAAQSSGRVNIFCSEQ